MYLIEGTLDTTKKHQQNPSETPKKKRKLPSKYNHTTQYKANKKSMYTITNEEKF